MGAVLREQNALPDRNAVTQDPKAKDAIDNGGAGRAAKSAIPLETHQNRVIMHSKIAIFHENRNDWCMFWAMFTFLLSPYK